jgi:hypothetical protein
MGWLRDSMRQTRSPHRSFGAVARAAVAHPAWPKDAKSQPRSLASLLSKLDRGMELQWLADRPPVQQVLAEVLGVPPSRVAEVAAAALTQSDDYRRRLRLDDLPFGSPLDLAQEPLPPGIPEIILQPQAWRRLWWVAPSGSGRSLVGAWLSVRRLATFIAAPDFETAAARLPGDKPAFVEIWSRSAEPSFGAPSHAVCVAGPFPPGRGATAAWTVVESPPPSEYAASLVRWAALRLPKDGHFVPELAEDWLRAAAARGEIDGLGTALGFLGLMDQYGTPELERRGVAKMADRFVQDRFAELRRNGGLEAAWLTEESSGILSALARRLLTDSSSAWEEARPVDEWLRLIPAEYQRALDAEWVRASISRTKDPPTLKELEQALRALPPGPFRIVRSLEQAGLLRSKHGSDATALAPRWLARHLVARARAEIAGGTPTEWSDALVALHAAGSTANALVSRTLTGDPSVLEGALELSDGEDPAAVAAVETAVRAAGLAVLSGVEIPADLGVALWDKQTGLLVELEDGPHPRLGYARFVTETEPILELGTFRLAALALSETLGTQSGVHHPVLRPWLGHESPNARATLDSIWEVVRRLDPYTTPWVRGAYALADRLRALREEKARVEVSAKGIHPLEWPHSVLHAIGRNELEWQDVARVGSDSVGALLAVATHEGVGLRTVSLAFWRAWAAAPEPLHDESPLSPTGAHARTFYSCAAPAALELLFARGLVTRESVPYSLLDEPAWRGVIAARPDALSGVPAAWVAMPKAILREALRTSTPSYDDMRGAWERDPEIVLGAIDDALDRDDPLATNLLAAAPPSRTTEIVERLTERLLGATWLRRQQTLETKKWIVERVAQRSEGWQAAFEFLTALG